MVTQVLSCFNISKDISCVSAALSLAIMAPEILSTSPLVDRTLVKEAVTETLPSLDTSNATLIRSNLAPLFQENTLAKILGAAEAYLENNVGGNLSLFFRAI